MKGHFLSIVASGVAKADPRFVLCYLSDLPFLFLPLSKDVFISVLCCSNLNVSPKSSLSSVDAGTQVWNPSTQEAEGGESNI